MSDRPVALFEAFLPGAQGRSFRFDGLERILTAETPEQVPQLLDAVDQAVAAAKAGQDAQKKAAEKAAQDEKQRAKEQMDLEDALAQAGAVEHPHFDEMPEVEALL